MLIYMSGIISHLFACVITEVVMQNQGVSEDTFQRLQKVGIYLIFGFVAIAAIIFVVSLMGAIRENCSKKIEECENEIKKIDQQISELMKSKDSYQSK